MARRAGAQASRWMLILDKLASSRTGYNVTELAEEFECTVRTIYRDFQHIESWLQSLRTASISARTGSCIGLYDVTRDGKSKCEE